MMIFGRSISVLTLALILSTSCQFTPEKSAVSVIPLDEIIQPDLPVPKTKYGITVDSLDEVIGKIRWNQNLANILARHGVDNETIYNVAKAAKGIFDVRKLKANHSYTIFRKKDSLQTATHFVFEPDKTEYVVFSLNDSIYVKRTKNPVEVEERTLSGTITSSVYETVVGQGESSILVHRLVDVFAWQVDFFRIQKGDAFKVIYEVQKVGDDVINVGAIKGAWFKHFDKEYVAINFENKGQESYFDEEGNSLRKTFLRAPLDYTRISSRYTPRRFHPVLKRYKAHLGTDYAAPTGTPIRSVGDGVVLEATYNSGNGNYVKIRHNSNYTTQYLHMSKIASGIRPGTKVKQSQTIGYVGSTGLANGPHLCFRFWKNGVQVDALKVDLPPSEPVRLDAKDDYLHRKNVVMYQLDNIPTEMDSVQYVQASIL